MSEKIDLKNNNTELIDGEDDCNNDNATDFFNDLPQHSMKMDNDELCGWLYKSGKRKNSKKLRWFCYKKDKNVLIYYANSHDVNTPLGEISLADATFIQTIVQMDGIKLHSLDIQTPQKTHKLFHKDQTVIDYWRHCLQDIREQMFTISLHKVNNLIKKTLNSVQMDCEDNVVGSSLDDDHHQQQTKDNQIKMTQSFEMAPAAAAPDDIEEEDESAILDETTATTTTTTTDFSIKNENSNELQTPETIETTTGGGGEEEEEESEENCISSTFVDFERAHLEVGPNTNSQHAPTISDVSLKKFALEAKNVVSKTMSMKSISTSDSISYHNQRRRSTKWHVPTTTTTESTNDAIETAPTASASFPTSASFVKRSTHIVSTEHSISNKSPPSRFSISNMFTSVFQKPSGHAEVTGGGGGGGSGNASATLPSSSFLSSHHQSCQKCLKKDEEINELREQIHKLTSISTNALPTDVKSMSLEDLQFQVQMLKEIIESKDYLLQRTVEEKTPSAEQNEREKLREQLMDSLRINAILKEENSKLSKMWSQWQSSQNAVVKSLQKMTAGYQRQLQSYKQRIANYSSTSNIRRTIHHLPSSETGIFPNSRFSLTINNPNDSIDGVTNGDIALLQDADVYGFYHQAYSDVGGDPSIYLNDSSLWAEYTFESDYDAYEAGLLEKWTRFRVSQTPGQLLKKSIELKNLLRQGIPCNLRQEIWTKLIMTYLDNDKATPEALRTNYESHLKQGLERSSTLSSVIARQVDLDLHRCMPENIHFRQNSSSSSSKANNTSDDAMATTGTSIKSSSIEGDLLGSLRNVLIAFAESTMDSIGYCQGIDRIAAVLLLILPEEMAFTALVIMLRKLRPNEYYSTSLIDAQVDQRVFAEMLTEFCPTLQRKFQSLNIDVSLFTLSWFITLFIDGFSWKLFMKVLDAFLLEGDKIIFRYAVAIFMHLEPIFMKQNDAGNIMRIIRSAGRLTLDHEKVTMIAFERLKHFPKRRINARRKHYRVLIQEELTEIQRLRVDRSGINDMLVNNGDDADAE